METLIITLNKVGLGHKAILTFLLSFPLIFVSCEKDEIPVKPFDRGVIIQDTVQQITIEMGSNYLNQIWYDLGENKVVSTNNRFDWDIAFDCSESSNWVYLNGAIAMMSATTGQTDFDAEIDIKNLFFRPDHPSGIRDSLSIGRWWETNEVWIIDLGYKLDGKSRGKRKIQFELEDNGSLTFTYATLKGENKTVGTIAKNNLYNRMAFSFESNTEITIEPAKTEYDLEFTQYMHLYYNPYYPYLVSGAILNPNNTIATTVFNIPFEEITLESFADNDLNDSSDVIGFDWKNYDIEASLYTVFPSMNYIVRDQDGYFYKLHFLDFYNESGEKGYPLMEFKKL